MVGNGGFDVFFWYLGDGDDMIDGSRGPSKPFNVDTGRFMLDTANSDTMFRVTGDDVVTVLIDGDLDDSAQATVKNVEEFFVYGGQDDDTIDFHGYVGHDLKETFIRGEAGDDRIFGTSGADTVRGDGGDDVTKCGDDDFVRLRAGNDTYVLQGGNDLVYLGGGRDTVEINSSYVDGYDTGLGWLTIADFNAEKDKLRFETGDFKNDGYLDTNGDGYLGRGDLGVGVKNGALTLDLARFAPPGNDALPNTITLLGFTKLDMDAVDFFYIGI